MHTQIPTLNKSLEVYKHTHTLNTGSLKCMVSEELFFRPSSSECQRPFFLFLLDDQVVALVRNFLGLEAGGNFNIGTKKKKKKQKNKNLKNKVNYQ